MDLDHDLCRLIRYNSEMLRAICVYGRNPIILNKIAMRIEWYYMLTNREFAAMLRCVGRCRRIANELYTARCSNFDFI